MAPQPYALITGASSGIGKALAFELARRKINVLLVALPNTGLSDVVKHLGDTFDIVSHGIELDLTIAQAPAILHSWCVKNHFEVNILINNAGFGNLCSFEQTDPMLISSMINLNSKAMVMLTHQFIPDLKKFDKSYILNVGSLASFMPIPNKSVYAATKSFVYAFSYALRLELEPHGISVSCLCPGATLTSTHVNEGISKLKVGKNFIQLPESVAHTAVDGMMKNKFRIIPGWHNRILYFIRQVLPETGVRWILLRIFSRQKVDKPITKKRYPKPAWSLAPLDGWLK